MAYSPEYWRRYDLTLNILAIIPARGGSKGIPKKNIRLLAGKPLIEYTINAAKNSEFINCITVSTDEKEIAAIAEERDVEVIMRPSDIAKDESPIIDTINHTITTLKERDGFIPDIIVLLQPTSPLRNTADIDGAIQQFLSGNSDSLISVCENDHPPYWSFTITDQNLKPLFRKKMSSTRRQDLPKTYRPNGAIYISTQDSLKKYPTFISKNTLPYVMPSFRSIDIDTPFDFRLAEFLIKNQKKMQV